MADIWPLAPLGFGARKKVPGCGWMVEVVMNDSNELIDFEVLNDSRRRLASQVKVSARHLSLLVLGLGLAVSCQAEVYRWVDESGAVTYSNTPPADRKTGFRRVDVSVPQGRGQPLRRSEPAEAVSPRQDLDARVEDLQKQLDSERRARASADTRAALVQAAYEQRLADSVASRPAGVIPVVTGPVWVRQEGDGRRHGRRDRDPGPHDDPQTPVPPAPRPMQRFR